jgi:hypothetical protein
MPVFSQPPQAMQGETLCSARRMYLTSPLTLLVISSTTAVAAASLFPFFLGLPRNITIFIGPSRPTDIKLLPLQIQLL